MTNPKTLVRLVAAVAAVLILAFATDASARGGGHATRTSVGGGGGNVNRDANVNRNANANVNRNTNVNANRNTNVNVDRNVNVNVDADRGWDNDYHPVARAAAVTTAVAVTAAAIGSIAYSIPPSCAPVMVGNMTYQQCGSTWYQPQYSGSSVQYIVVSPPN